MDKKLVFPGDFLSTEEEFEAGKNTFGESGEVFSDSFGKPVFDQKQRTVLVRKKKQPKLLERDCIVIGRVMLVKSNMVMIEPCFAEKNGEEYVINSSYSVLPARNISRLFVKNLGQLFKIGDIVKAEVASVTPYSIDLRTSKPELGVIKAFCSRCRNALALFGESLKCQNCGQSEDRKLSTDYFLK